MKKSQRARLSALLAKDQASLTAEEKSELSTLQALAAQHPDASKDTDDTAPAAASPTLQTVIAAAFNKLRSGNANAADLAAARQQVATLTTERDSARQQVATLTTERDSARSAVTAICTFFGIDAATVSSKPSSEAFSLIEQKVSALVGEQVASLGFPAAKLPAAIVETPAKPAARTDAEHLAHYESLPEGSKERREYSAKHFDALARAGRTRTN